MAEKWQDTLVAPAISKTAEQCAHYYAMLHDIDLANMSLVRMAQHQSMRDHEDSDAVSENMCLDYALMHYFRCFDDDEFSLNISIFSVLTDKKKQEALRLHTFFKDTHELKTKRPTDIFSSVKIGVALETGENKGVQDIFWLMNRFQVCKPDLTKAFSGLVAVVKSQISVKAKTATEALLKEAEDKGNDELYAIALNAKEFSEQQNEKGG